MTIPKVSLCLFSYNQEKYIVDALKGVLSQEYENLEIVISDDASTDNTFTIIKETIALYKGAHKIVLNRNEKNLGLVPHVNKLIFELASSEYILFAAGDDICLPNRVEVTMQLFNQFPKAIGVSFAKTEIDAHNKVIKDFSCQNKKPEIFNLYNGYLKSSNFMVPGFGLGFKRKDIMEFSPLNEDCQTEDSTLRYRCILKGDFVFSYQKIMLYRWHGENLSYGSNIFKLKTQLIAKQYKDDTRRAFNNGFISKNYYLHLVSKIKFYERNRTLLEKINSSNGIVKKLKLYQLKLARYIYLIKYYILNFNNYPKVLKDKYAVKKKDVINRKRYKSGIKNKNLIKAWWVNFPNFGDQLTPFLLTYFGYVPYYVPVDQASLISVGSLFEMVPSTFKGKFLGTGFIEEGKTKKFELATFIGVRGMLSKKRLNLGDETILGDPGLLAHLLLSKRETKKYKLGILIHHKEFKILSLKKEIESFLKKYKNEVIFISVRSLDPIPVIKKIDQCEAIISSAMHGLIVADALQIPNKWIVFSNRLEGGDYKFKDYYSVFGETPSPLFFENSFPSLSELIKSTEKRDLNILEKIQQKLIKAFENLSIENEK